MLGKYALVKDNMWASLVQVSGSERHVGLPLAVCIRAANTLVTDASIKLSHVVNDTLEGEVTRPTNDDMTKPLLVYQTRCGGLPRDEIEPTPDQIWLKQPRCLAGMGLWLPERRFQNDGRQDQGDQQTSSERSPARWLAAPFG